MKKQNRKTEIIKIFILLVCIAVIASAATKIIYFTHEYFSVYDAKTLNAKFITGNKVGLSADSDMLDFGIVPLGGSSSKEIKLYHNHKKPLKIEIVYKGDIKEMLSPVAPFYLEPGVEQKLRITAYAKGEENKEYTGTVTIIYLKT